MSQNPRPRSVTIISWYLIISGAYRLIYFGLNYQLFDDPLMRSMLEKSPLPIEAQIAQIFVGGAITVVTGLAMLKGQNWGRWLYLLWAALGLIVGLLTSPMKLMILPGMLVVLTIAFFLFRPKANAFFGQPHAEQPHAEQVGGDHETGH